MFLQCYRAYNNMPYLYINTCTIKLADQEEAHPSYFNPNTAKAEKA